MTEVPPDMEFEKEFDDDDLFDAEPRRTESKRYEYAWEKVAATAPYPDDRYSFTHEGTVYRATNATDINLMRQAVERRNG